MKKFFVFTIALILANVGLSNIATAQKKKSGDNVEVFANIAVIDIIQIRRDAKVFKHLRKQINGYREQLKKNARNEDAELQKANRELARQRAIITPEAFREERKKFETRVGSAQKNLQSRWRILKEAERKYELKILDSLQKASIKVAQKRRLILILRKSAIYYWAETLEITKDVIDNLNKMMPTIKVAVPKGFSPLSASKKSSKKK